MKEYRVVASIYNDLHTPAVVKNLLAKAPGHSTSVHTIRCNSLEEIHDLFLDICGNECSSMNTRMYWYVDAGNGWELTGL